MKIKDINTDVCTKGYWIGERIVQIVMDDEGEETDTSEVVLDVLKKLSKYSMSVISFAGDINWDDVMDFSEYVHEHYKIVVNTDAKELIPAKFLCNSQTFISISPNLNKEFDLPAFEHNLLRMIKLGYLRYELIFMINADDDIRDVMDFLANFVIPKHLTVILTPDIDTNGGKKKGNKEKGLYIDKLTKLMEMTSKNTDIVLKYDVRVLPDLDIIRRL